jgi:hypothetical protein
MITRGQIEALGADLDRQEISDLLDLLEAHERGEATIARLSLEVAELRRLLDAARQTNIRDAYDRDPCDD